MNVKIIFLDVDGVLNSIDSEDHLGPYIGIDYSGVKLLKEIVDNTGAEIVLVSSWKHGWHKTGPTTRLACYLAERLAQEGLSILDKTVDNITNRGKGIYNWLSIHPEIKSWVILDDEIFEDYEQYGCMSHLVKTSFYDGGLKDRHVEQAISLLNTIE